MIPASRATPAVRAYIRSKFAQYCRDRGKTRLCEKSPANTMRLPFVLEVLSGAKVIHIIRTVVT